MKKSRLVLCSVIIIFTAVSLSFFLGCNGSESLEGKLYVGGYNTEQVYVVDIEQKAVVKIIDFPAGVQPDWLTLSPDGTKLFCSALNLFQVHVIDTTTDTYVDAVDVCENPKGIAFTSDGGIAAVVQDFDISLIDVDTLTYNNDTSDTISGVRGTGGIVIHPTLNKLYLPGKDITFTDNQVYVSDIVGNATPVGYTILHPSDLKDVEITADGSMLFVSGFGLLDIMHFLDVNTADGSINSHISKDIEHISDWNYTGEMELAPDNTKLYIGAYSSSMLDYVDLPNIITMESIDFSDYTSPGTGPRDIAFSPGSTYAFVLVDGMDDLIVILKTSDDSVIDTIPLPNCDPRSLVYKP
jgi:DNA-binding beta-propeller fold protein YncE